MDKIKPFEWLTNNIIAIGALLLSIIVFANDCSQRSQLRQIETKLNALNFRPQFIVDTLKINSIEGELNSIEEDSVNNGPALIFNTFINIEYQIELLNIGNTNATIIATACMDTISGSAEKLRSFFTDQKSTFRLDTAGNYYYPIKIVPEEKYTSVIKRRLGFLDQDIFTLHFLVLYENDLGIMYDTYYLARFKVDRRDQKVQFSYQINKDSLKSGTLKLKVPENLSMPTNLISTVDSNTDFKIYNSEEKKIILEILRDRL